MVALESSPLPNYQPDWISGNILNPAINELVVSPGNVLINAANALSHEASGKDTFQKLEQRPTSEAAAGSLEFWTQATVDGLSSAVVYAAAGKVIGGFGRSAAITPLEELSRLPALKAESLSMTGSALKVASSFLAKGQTEQIIGAAAYDFARDPGQGQTRTGDMMGSAAAFGLYGILNPRLAGLSLIPRLVAHAQVGMLGSAAQIGAGALGGNSVNLDAIPQTLTTGAVMNMALPGAQRAIGRTIDLANTKLDRGVPLERQMQYADLSGRSSHLDKLAGSNAQVRVKETQLGNQEDHERSSISLGENPSDKGAYGEQLGHALAHIQSARWGLQESLFTKAQQALNQGDQEGAWQQFRQARLDEERQAIQTGADIRQELEASMGIKRSSQTSAVANARTQSESIAQEIIPRTGKTYEQTWRDEFDQHFVATKGLYRPSYDYSTGSDSGSSIKHLQHVFDESGYFADPKQIVQISASLDAKPVGGAFLFGQAGSGKTFVTEIVAKAIGAHYFYKQAFPGTREENLLVDILPDQNSSSGVKEYPGVLVKASQFLKDNPNETAVLVLDEWDKTRPSADSILLDFLQKGRINHGSVDLELTPEQMSRLKVFIALNDERELSEPLLRRLPMIKFDAPDVSVVRQSLEFSHGEHELIPALLSLYQHAQTAQMTKPVTIQELRQVIDAYDNIKNQGLTPDWDDLVRHFVTKTEENHALLKAAELNDIDNSSGRANRSGARLDPTKYQFDESETGTPLEDTPASLPSLHKLRAQKMNPRVNGIKEQLDENTAGIVPFSEDNYNNAVRLATKPAEDSSRIGEVAHVVGDDADGKVIIFDKPLLASGFQQTLAPFWRQPGEVSVTEPKAKWQNIKQLQKQGLQITEFSSNRIVGRFPGVDLVWTPDRGAEFTVNLKQGTTDENPLTKLGVPNWYNEKGSLKAPQRQRTREGSYEISLGSGLPKARIETDRAQSSPGARTVQLKLSLPSNHSTVNQLHPSLVFGSQLEIASEGLAADWGVPSRDGKYQVGSYYGRGNTWQEATNDGLQQMHQDIAKLLQARRRHLPTQS